MNTTRPVLVSLTSPTAAGKTHLFNYIRDVAKLPTIVSTTTRQPRAGEVDGVDYHFISTEESLALERDNELAELAVYRGVRYGVTRTELATKLAGGLAFVILEPTGIDHYVAEALKLGAMHLKYFIYTDPVVRIDRFKKRVNSDVEALLSADTIDKNKIAGTVTSHLDRLVSMLTVETKWGEMQQWDRILFGEHSPEQNMEIMMRDIERRLEKERQRAAEMAARAA